MTWLLKYRKTLLAGAIAGLLFGAGVWQGSDHVQRKWDEDKARQVKAQLEKNRSDEAKLRKLEETKNENIVEIDRLRANNHAMWLRLPKTPCTGSAPSSDTATGTGELSTAPEIAFKRFTDGLADEAYRADRVVEDCRVLNDFVR